MRKLIDKLSCLLGKHNYISWYGGFLTCTRCNKLFYKN